MLDFWQWILSLGISDFWFWIYRTDLNAIPNKLSSCANAGQRIDYMLFCHALVLRFAFWWRLLPCGTTSIWPRPWKTSYPFLGKSQSAEFCWMSNTVLLFRTGGRRGQCEHPFYCRTLLWVSLRSAHACLLRMIRLSSLPQTVKSLNDLLPSLQLLYFGRTMLLDNDPWLQTSSNQLRLLPINALLDLRSKH